MQLQTVGIIILFINLFLALFLADASLSVALGMVGLGFAFYKVEREENRTISKNLDKADKAYQDFIQKEVIE